jgi:hypothetical protein
MAIVLDGTTGITTPALDSAARFATEDMPLGSVLQVVQGIAITELDNSTTTYVDTTLTATITPTSATSKILVIVTQNYYRSGASSGLNFKLFRGATDLGQFLSGGGYSASANVTLATAAFQTLDTPSTTSPVTYKTQFANWVAGAFVRVQYNGVNGPSHITLMEIAA